MELNTLKPFKGRLVQSAKDDPTTPAQRDSKSYTLGRSNGLFSDVGFETTFYDVLEKHAPEMLKAMTAGPVLQVYDSGDIVVGEVEHACLRVIASPRLDQTGTNVRLSLRFHTSSRGHTIDRKDGDTFKEVYDTEVDRGGHSSTVATE